MNVVISPNIKRTSERIDPIGNVINPRTKQVVRSADEGSYTPTAEELANAQRTTERIEPQKEEPKENPLAKMIQEQVKKAVEESVKSIDISSMVKKAIEDSFK